MTLILFDSTAAAAQIVCTFLSLAISMVSLTFSLRNRHSDEKQREEEERKSQAVKIACWMEDYDAIVVNSSDLPIYGVAIVADKGPWFYSGSRREVTSAYYPGAAAMCHLIPPGKWRIPIPNLEGCWGGSFYPAPKISFMSSNGLAWVRDCSGELIEIDKEPAAFFNLSMPYPSADLQRIF